MMQIILVNSFQSFGSPQIKENSFKFHFLAVLIPTMIKLILTSAL